MVISRAVLAGAGEPRHMEELARLSGTLGIQVSAVIEQNRRDNTGYMGRGKREELRELVDSTGAEAVITDDELTASQSRVLERAAGVSVVDRTELIIRIFESHARDRASKLEVELAELEYRLPRVKGQSTALSRLGGGVGTRGPGEQQLEYDRRLIRERIEKINKRLEEERKSREVRSARLVDGGPPKVALVGYTNAGKTTILNALSGVDRSTRDRLFETLETTTRRVEGESNGLSRHDGRNGSSAGGTRPDFVLTDTVGFIRKLPTQLVHSFSSTLGAARNADMVVLCADAGSVELEDEIRTVRETLAETFGEEEMSRKEPLLCLNKTDLLSGDEIQTLGVNYPDAVMISAHEGAGPLLERIYGRISAGRWRLEILIPHAEYGKAARLYGRAEIHDSHHTQDGLWMDVTLPESITGEYRGYRVA